MNLKNLNNEKAVELINKLIEDEECEIIYLAHSGSVLHGTDTENSDTDITGLFIPKKSEVLWGDPKTCIEVKTNEDTRNTKDDIDITLYSVREFFRLLERSDPAATDILFSMFADFSVIYDTPESKTIAISYKDFLTNKAKGFTGMSMKQVSKYLVKGARFSELESFMNLLEDKTKNMIKPELKKVKVSKFLPEIKELISTYKHIKIEDSTLVVLNRRYEYESTPLEFFLKSLNDVRKNYGSRVEAAATNDGKDFKAMSHALRAIEEAIELLSTQFIRFPLDYAPILQNIKLGQYDKEKITDFIEDRFDLLMELEDKLKDSNMFNQNTARMLTVNIYSNYL